MTVLWDSVQTVFCFLPEYITYKVIFLLISDKNDHQSVAIQQGFLLNQSHGKSVTCADICFQYSTQINSGQSHRVGRNPVFVMSVWWYMPFPYSGVSLMLIEKHTLSAVKQENCSQQQSDKSVCLEEWVHVRVCPLRNSWTETNFCCWGQQLDGTLWKYCESIQPNEFNICAIIK